MISKYVEPFTFQPFMFAPLAGEMTLCYRVCQLHFRFHLHPYSAGKTVAMSSKAIMGKESDLPHEAIHSVPKHLVAAFSVTQPEQRNKGDDDFNTLDLTIVRDNSNRVDNNTALISAVNDYE
jgi:hypothetical protein